MSSDSESDSYDSGEYTDIESEQDDDSVDWSDESESESRRDVDPLRKACKDGNVQEVRRLLAAYDLGSAAAAKQPPLHVAASVGNSDCLRAVLDWTKSSKWFGVNHMSEGGSTALHSAAWSSAECTRILLENGADPIIRDKYGMTPLHEAVMMGKCYDVVEIILEFGAKKMKTERGFVKTIETGSYRCPHIGETIEPALLLREALSCPDWDINVIRRMLDAGASMEIRDAVGESILDIVLLEELRDDVVKLLCERGLSADIINGPTDTDPSVPCKVLCHLTGWRAVKKKRNIVQTLVEHGANVVYKHLEMAVKKNDVVLFDELFSYLCRSKRLLLVLADESFPWVYHLLYGNLGLLETVLRNGFASIGMARDCKKKGWKRENLLGPLLTQNYTRRSTVAALRLLQDTDVVRFSRQDPCSLTDTFPTMHEFMEVTDPVKDRRERVPSPLFVRRHWHLLARMHALLDWELDWMTLMLTGPQVRSINNCVVRAFSLVRAYCDIPLEQLINFEKSRGLRMAKYVPPKCQRELDKHAARHRLIAELYALVSARRLSPADARALRLPTRDLCQPASLASISRSAIYGQLRRTLRRSGDGRCEKLAPVVGRAAVLLPEHVRPALTLHDANTRRLLRRMFNTGTDSAWVQTGARRDRALPLKMVGEAARPRYTALLAQVQQWELDNGSEA